MTLDRWRRVKEVFHGALEGAPEDRAVFLGAACGDDEALRAEVERLLAAHAQAGSFIEASPVAAIVERPASRFVMTGQRIAHYEVGRLIGTGGMGEVYVARDTELRRPVALKVVSGGDPGALAVRREAQHASQLNHPHICTIHEVGVIDDRAYIAMEYIEGRPLGELIGTDGLPVETMVRYGIQIADALAHAHGRGVEHRDLKSANVVVTSDGRAKVLDFGLARGIPTDRVQEHSQSHRELVQEGRLAGTLPYMAPELLRGEVADARADIWALGIVLFEMAAGQRPFDGGTAFELSAAILDAPPAQLPPHIPAPLKAIIRRCLAKDPHERYGHAVEVRSALEAVQAEVAIGSSQSYLLTATRFLRSHAAAVTVVGLVAAIVLALIATRSWRRTDARAAPIAVGASGRPAIAVMDFDSRPDTQDTVWLSKGVPSMLVTGLAQTRGLEVVSTQRLHDAAAQIGADSLDTLTRSQAADVARRAGAGAIVVGSVFKSEAEFRIDAQLEDLSNGRIIMADSVRGTDLFALVDRLAARIRDGAGFQAAANVRGVTDVSTTSLEAYRLYSQGVDACTSMRLDDAHQLFEKAVAIDSTFADAYRYLGLINSIRGFPALRREYLRRAAEHSDRLSEPQRLLLDIDVARDSGNSTLAVRLLDELIAKYPDVDAYGIAFNVYRPVIGMAPNPEKLLAILAAGARALPSSTRVRHVNGYALMFAGRYAEGLRELEAYAELAPREPNPYDSLGEGYLLMGAAEKAVEAYSRALAIDPTFSFAHNGRAWSLATLGRYEQAVAENRPRPSIKAAILSRVGRYREAAQAITEGRRQAEGRGDIEEQGSLHLLSSALSIERTHYSHSLQEIRSAEAIFGHLPPERRRVYLVLADLLRGVAEARTGRIDNARLRLESQRRTYLSAVDTENWWHRALEGEIALASGDVRKAAAAFLAGEPSRRWSSFVAGTVTILANNLPFRDGLARAAKRRGDVQSAIQIYRRLLTPGPGQKWIAVFEPLYVLEIARLLDRIWEKEAARQEYRRFLDFWKQADSDLPELAEARRAVERITLLERTTP